MSSQLKHSNLQVVFEEIENERIMQTFNPDITET